MHATADDGYRMFALCVGGVVVWRAVHHRAIIVLVYCLSIIGNAVVFIRVCGVCWSAVRKWANIGFECVL